MLEEICQADPSWSCLTLRYFNPVGAHPSAKIGENPNGIPSNLVPFIAQVAAGIRTEALVFGVDYATPDGTGVRDYIHVSDLAKGHLKALNYAKANRGFEAFNLGTSKGHSVLDVIATFESVFNSCIPYRITGRRIGDIAECWADAQKAGRLLNWRAEKELSEMLLDTWRWQTQKLTPTSKCK
jgi:UDP-glucose 4-epimerase